jgi:hypothetical protein
MSLQIISADERMAERKGVKALVCGAYGVGKTSLLRTLNPAETLFVDLEAGAMSVRDVPVDEIRPKTWEECRDLACFFAGPDTNKKDRDSYSEKHFEKVCEQFGDPRSLDKYSTLFVDSLTIAARMCLAWAEQQPESFNAKGQKDTRGMYGLYGRELTAWATRLQHARTRNVVLVSLLDQKEDDFKRKSWVLQVPGGPGNAIPGLVDVVLTLAVIDPEDGPPFRAFVTDVANEFGYPAKYRTDRPGCLEALEKPHLGELFAKLNEDTARGASAKTTPRAAA